MRYCGAYTYVSRSLVELTRMQMDDERLVQYSRLARRTTEKSDFKSITHLYTRSSPLVIDPGHLYCNF